MVILRFDKLTLNLENAIIVFWFLKGASAPLIYNNMENSISIVPGDLFENKDGIMFVYVGSKPLPILHSKKSMSFLKREDFYWSEEANEWFVNMRVELYHFFLPVLSNGSLTYVYTGKEMFRFLNIKRLVKLKRKFSGLKLGDFKEKNRNLFGMNNLAVAIENFNKYSYHGFDGVAVGMASVSVPLSVLVFEPKMKNVSCGPCENFYPATQSIFNFMQVYERLLESDLITGYFVNKNARLVEFSVKHLRHLKFEFTFKEICSKKTLTIQAQTLFDLRRWYSSIPFDSKAVDFICMAGSSCPKDGMPWDLLSIEVQHRT